MATWPSSNKRRSSIQVSDALYVRDSEGLLPLVWLRGWFRVRFYLFIYLVDAKCLVGGPPGVTHLCKRKMNRFCTPKSAEGKHTSLLHENKNINRCGIVFVVKVVSSIPPSNPPLLFQSFLKAAVSLVGLVKISSWNLSGLVWE